jgi:hypothetical protein
MLAAIYIDVGLLAAWLGARLIQKWLLLLLLIYVLLPPHMCAGGAPAAGCAAVAAGQACRHAAGHGATQHLRTLHRCGPQGSAAASYLR